mmetsp:Transcript_1284/g.3260  ORF Transcript_1284/g.3260 Transcript_1284/m.3260 type:complete len:206 (+) Transcript_1284:509-1126(+)
MRVALRQGRERDATLLHEVAGDGVGGQQRDKVQRAGRPGADDAVEGLACERVEHAEAVQVVRLHVAVDLPRERQRHVLLEVHVVGGGAVREVAHRLAAAADGAAVAADQLVEVLQHAQLRLARRACRDDRLVVERHEERLHPRVHIHPRVRLPRVHDALHDLRLRLAQRVLPGVLLLGVVVCLLDAPVHHVVAVGVHAAPVFALA